MALRTAGWQPEKNCILLTTLLPCLEDPQCMVYGKDLGVEDLLVVTQVEAPACSTLTDLPGARCSHPTAAEPRSVGPDGASDRPTPGRLQGWSLLTNGVLSGEEPVSLQTWGSTVFPGLLPGTALSLLTVTPLSLSRVSSEPPPFCGLASNRCAKRDCRWSSSARAGVSAAIPWGVGLNAPRVDLAMRLMARGCPPESSGVSMKL